VHLCFRYQTYRVSLQDGQEDKRTQHTSGRRARYPGGYISYLFQLKEK
jgi:hypothetical protein